MIRGGDIYYAARSRTKYKLTSNQPATESCRGEPTPLSTPDSVAASVLSVYAQTELSLSTRAGGSSARWVSADRRPRMTTAHITAARRQGGERKRRNERVCAQRRTPLQPTGVFEASTGRSRTPEAKKRHTAAGLPGLPGVPGVLTPPSLKIGGGEGGRARVGLRMPRMGRFSSPEVLEE